VDDREWFSRQQYTAVVGCGLPMALLALQRFANNFQRLDTPMAFVFT
jgi:hypothetical protein